MNKNILYLILALVPSLGICQEYRFFELLVSDEFVSYDERADPAHLLAGIDGEGITLKSYAVVRKDSEKPFSFDRTVNVRSPEVIGSVDVQYPESNTKVGLEITVTEKADKRVKLEYEQSEIEKWIPIGGMQGVLVPLFATSRLEGDLDFSKSDFVFLGGLKRESTYRILIIQRGVEPDDAGYGGSARREER